jgi:hypothetical protein
MAPPHRSFAARWGRRILWTTARRVLPSRPHDHAGPVRSKTLQPPRRGEPCTIRPKASAGASGRCVIELVCPTAVPAERVADDGDASSATAWTARGFTRASTTRRAGSCDTVRPGGPLARRTFPRPGASRGDPPQIHSKGVRCDRPPGRRDLGQPSAIRRVGKICTCLQIPRPRFEPSTGSGTRSFRTAQAGCSERMQTGWRLAVSTDRPNSSPSAPGRFNSLRLNWKETPAIFKAVPARILRSSQGFIFWI